MRRLFLWGTQPALAALALSMVLLGWAGPAGAAITEIGTCPGASCQRVKGQFDNQPSGTAVYPNNVTNGNLLISAGTCWQALTGPGAITVTDTRSTSYTVKTRTSTFDSSYVVFIAYGVASSSGANTVTVDPANTSYCSWGTNEYTGQHATPFDAENGTDVASSTTPSISHTTVAANALIIGVLAYMNGSGNFAITPGGSYTQIAEEEDNGTHTDTSAVFRIVTTAQAYTVDWTLATARETVIKTVSFAPAVAAGCARRLTLLGVGC